MYFKASLITATVFASRSLAQYNYGSGYSSADSGSYGASASSSATMASDTPVSSPTMMPMVPVMPASSSMVAPAMPSSTPDSSSGGGMVNVQVVKVSNKEGTLTFTPNSIQAAVGSMVQFQFYPKNHSVVQSTFDQPCVPINNIMPNVTGVFSGFMPVINNVMPMYTITINDTKPFWYYCSQGKHCQSGMVGVINPPAANKSRTIDTFMNLAKSAPVSLSPGQGGKVMGGSNSTMSTGTRGSGLPGSPTASSSIALQTVNAAPGSVFVDRKGMYIGVGLAGLVSTFVLFA